MIAFGAAYGTAKAGISIAGVGTFKSELIMKVQSQQTKVLIAESHPCCHVWNHRCIRTSHGGPHSWLLKPAGGLLPIQVFLYFSVFLFAVG